MTHYVWGYSKSFEDLRVYFSPAEKASIAAFILIYQDHGLDDFSMYPGKVARTGSGDCSEEEKAYAKKHHLWHYHIGIPNYVQSPSGKYYTSRDVLHFQWFQKENRILLVDMYRHYLIGGKFYVPPVKAFEILEPEVKSSGPEANDDSGDVPEAV